MKHTVFFLSSPVTVASAEVIASVSDLFGRLVFFFDNGLSLYADECFNTENQCREFYGLPLKQEVVLVVVILSVEVVHYIDASYTHVTNFSPRFRRLYELSIQVYLDIYGEDIFKIGVDTCGDGGGLYVRSGVGDCSDFWEIFHTLENQFAVR